jgi:hypothetical protein
MQNRRKAAVTKPLRVTHEEFLKIDEYRWHIAEDLKGSEEMPEENKVLDLEIN